MAGLFDDLVPEQHSGEAPQSMGLFDDLVPDQKKAPWSFQGETPWEDAPEYIKRGWERMPATQKAGTKFMHGVVEAIQRASTGLRQAAIEAIPEDTPYQAGLMSREQKDALLAKLPKHDDESIADKYSTMPPDFTQGWFTAGEVSAGIGMGLAAGSKVPVAKTAAGRLIQNTLVGGASGAAAYADPNDPNSRTKNIATGGLLGALSTGVSEAFLASKRWAMTKYKEIYESGDELLDALVAKGKKLSTDYNVPLNPYQETGHPKAGWPTEVAKSFDATQEALRRRGQMEAYSKASEAVQEVLSPEVSRGGQSGKIGIKEVFNTLRTTRDQNFNALVNKAVELTNGEQIIPVGITIRQMRETAEELASNPNPKAVAVGKHVYESILPRLENLARSRNKLSVSEYKDLLSGFSDMARNKVDPFERKMAGKVLASLRDTLDELVESPTLSKASNRAINLLKAARSGYAEESTQMGQAIIPAIKKVLNDPTLGSAQGLLDKIPKMKAEDLRALVGTLEEFSPNTLSLLQRSVLENAHVAAVEAAKRDVGKPLTEFNFNIPAFLNKFPTEENFRILFQDKAKREGVEGLIKLGGRLMQYADSSSSILRGEHEKYQKAAHIGARVLSEGFSPEALKSQAPWTAGALAKYISPTSRAYANHLMTPEGRNALKAVFENMQAPNSKTMERLVPALAYLAANSEVVQDHEGDSGMKLFVPKDQPAPGR